MNPLSVSQADFGLKSGSAGTSLNQNRISSFQQTKNEQHYQHLRNNFSSQNINHIYQKNAPTPMFNHESNQSLKFFEDKPQNANPKNQISNFMNHSEASGNFSRKKYQNLKQKNTVDCNQETNFSSFRIFNKCEGQKSSQKFINQKKEKPIIGLQNERSSDECPQCINHFKQNQRLLQFMREQIEITKKQYVDRMNKIIFEQAKQIKDLRTAFFNNQKNIINLNKISENSTFSPIKSSDKPRSTSKLSLTKSISSSFHNQGNKHKIATLSKQVQSFNKTVSPSKISSQQEKSLNTFSTVEQISQKIKTFEQYSHFLQKSLKELFLKQNQINTKIQSLEKNLLRVMSSKVYKIGQEFNLWTAKQQQRLNKAQQSVGLLACQVVKTSEIFLPNQKNVQNKKLGQQNSVLSHYPSQCGRSEQFAHCRNKLSMKLKKYSSELQDLRQMTQNLQSKEYKYDNFLISELIQAIQQLQKTVGQLEKSKAQLQVKLLEKHSRQIYGYSQSQIQSSLHLPKIGTDRMQKTLKQGLNSNNSLYSNLTRKEQSFGKPIATNTRTQQKFVDRSLKLSQNQIKRAETQDKLEPCSYSQFKGFTTKQQDFSQYFEDSIDNKESNSSLHEIFDQSFESQNNENEDDQFFYHTQLQGMKQSKKQFFPANHIDWKFQNNFPTPAINRLMQVISLRENRPLRIEIDETGYIKSADNGMYIVDRNMDGFDLHPNELEWLKERGIVILNQ